MCGEISKGLVERGGSLLLAFHAFHSPGIPAAQPLESESELLALVGDLQLQLPAFEAHQRATELLSDDLTTVDVEQRESPILGVVLPIFPHTRLSAR
jgi:hypothetical protein